MLNTPITIHVDNGAGALPYNEAVAALLRDTRPLDKVALDLLPHVEGTITLTRGAETFELEGDG